jgi:hypothetical protein
MDNEDACDLALLYQGLSLGHEFFGACDDLRIVF